MILKLLMLCSGEWEVPGVRARECITVTSWGCSRRDREMRSLAVPKMLRCVLCLTKTKWMVLYSRSE